LTFWQDSRSKEGKNVNDNQIKGCVINKFTKLIKKHNRCLAKANITICTVDAQDGTELSRMFRFHSLYKAYISTRVVKTAHSF